MRAKVQTYFGAISLKKIAGGARRFFLSNYL